MFSPILDAGTRIGGEMAVAGFSPPELEVRGSAPMKLEQRPVNEYDYSCYYPSLQSMLATQRSSNPTPGASSLGTGTRRLALSAAASSAAAGVFFGITSFRLPGRRPWRRLQRSEPSLRLSPRPLRPESWRLRSPCRQSL